MKGRVVENNNNYGNKREVFNQKDNENQSVNHFSRWEPATTTTATTTTTNSTNNYRNQSQLSSNSEMESTTTTKPVNDAPISLREKRKNNEYESPLARVRY